MTLVTIVVPVFDTPSHQLRQTLWTATHQTFRDDQYEVIIVDDGSTDPLTIATCADFADQWSNCRLVRHGRRRGIASARATGTTESVGQFLIFLDGGDALARDSAESLYYRARSLEADLVTAPRYLWDASTQTYVPVVASQREFPPDPTALAETIFHAQADLALPGKLIARSLLTEAAFSWPEAAPLSDLVTTTNVAMAASRIAFLDRFCYYRLRDTSRFDEADFAEHLVGLRLVRDRWNTIAVLGVAAGADDPQAFDWITTGIARLLESISAEVRNDCTAGGTTEQMVRSAAEEFDLLVTDAVDNQDLAAWLLGRDRDYASGEARGVKPSSMAERLAGKVVLVCQADYQLTAAVRFVEELRNRGYPCVVLDNSHAIARGKRASTPAQRRGLIATEYVKVATIPYEPDWLATACFVAAFNDFMPEFRESLEFRHRLGLPTACVVEGVNDFERTDFTGYHFLSYRRCDYVFTAGDDDARFFTDRDVRMVGLPNIEDLASRPVAFPRSPLVALNMNFSYGVLYPAASRIFLESAQTALARLGVKWLITRHPMDDTPVRRRHLYSGTQYQLIADCTVFVSRFATGILEALASGKPVVYFNPHAESIDKFSKPLGAFGTAVTAAELAEEIARALAEVDGGVDFRARAAPFLQRHTGWSPVQGRTAAARFADAVTGIIDVHTDVIQERKDALTHLMSIRSEKSTSPHTADEPAATDDERSNSRPVRRWYANSADRLRDRWPSGHAMIKGLRAELPVAVRQRQLRRVPRILAGAVRRGAPGAVAIARPVTTVSKRAAGNRFGSLGILALGVTAIGAARLQRRTGPNRWSRALRWLAGLGLGFAVTATTVREVQNQLRAVFDRERAKTMSILNQRIHRLETAIDRSDRMIRAQSASQQRLEQSTESAIQSLRSEIEQERSGMGTHDSGGSAVRRDAL